MSNSITQYRVKLYKINIKHEEKKIQYVWASRTIGALLQKKKIRNLLRDNTGNNGMGYVESYVHLETYTHRVQYGEEFKFK